MPAKNRFKAQSRIPLPGSEKAKASTIPAPVVAHAEAPTAPAGNVTVTVIVRRKREIDPTTLADRKSRLSLSKFATAYGPDKDSLKLVKAFAKEFGLKAKAHATAGPRHLSLTGSQTAMQQAFGVTFTKEVVNGHTFRCREGAITLPQELAGHVVAVLGLDNRPQAKPHFRAATAHATNISYTPPQVAALYGFPATASAAGQTIGIIELGGGYRPADLSAYFKTLNLTAPKVVAVSVDKGKNKPTTASGADGEVMLDIEVCASVAPGANIAVYFTPNTDQGFIDAISTALHDTVNKPSVLSISWGGPESSWTPQSTAALDQACQAAALLGVSITVAAGDNGSTDGVTDGANHVDFPASSPHVLACGGTRLTGSGNAISSEVVWNELAINEGATGGGVSNVFPLPTWQAKSGVPKPTAAGGGRGVPDVSGDADPSSGYTIRVDGETSVIGGTSAVAPLWAGLIALANAQNKTAAGFLNPALYANPKAFHDITSGTNGGFTAGPGWDACTGLGSPNAPLIIQTLAGTAATPAKPKPKKPKPTKKILTKKKAGKKKK